MSRTTLITGASRGLGRTLAQFFALRSHRLILTARTASDLEEVSSELAASGSEVIALPGDIADPSHRAALADLAADLGGLDVLINNASTLGPSPLPHLKDLSLSDFRDILEVNTLAPLALIQTLLPHLRPGGWIINISSDAALGGYEGWGGYGASKAALDLITRTLASELRPLRIAAVSVDPGDLRTEMHQAAFPGEDISDRPLPEVTIPFWAWLAGQDPLAISGRRFEAQAERWTLTSPAV